MNDIGRGILKLGSYCGLALSVLPAVLVYSGTVQKETCFTLMIAGMFLWFSTAIWWIKPDHEDA